VKTAVEELGQTKQELDFGAWKATVEFGLPKPDGGLAPGTKDAHGAALVAQLGPDEFLVTGLDATVLKTDTYETDMTFRNDMDTPVVIRSYTGSTFVRFDIWGVPDGRTVRLSAPKTSNHGTARETTVFNPNLAPGTSLRVEYMHNGFDAVVSRWVRDRDGDLIHEDTWFSRYRTVNGITEVGPKRSSD